MAKPTENRVNKAFVSPDEAQPAIDPGASDVIEEDRRYDAIEEHRIQAAEDRRYDAIEEHRARVAAENAQNVQQSSEPPSGRDLLTPQTDPGIIESLREERWEAEHPQPSDVVDTHIDGGPQDIQAEPFRPV